MANKTMKAVESGNKKTGLIGAGVLAGAKAGLKTAELNADGGRTMTSSKTATMGAQRTVRPATDTHRTVLEKDSAKTAIQRTTSYATATHGTALEKDPAKTAIQRTMSSVPATHGAKLEKDPAKTTTRQTTSKATYGIQAGMNVATATATTQRTLGSILVDHGAKLEKDPAKTTTRRTTSKATYGMQAGMNVATATTQRTLSSILVDREMKSDTNSSQTSIRRTMGSVKDTHGKKLEKNPDKVKLHRSTAAAGIISSVGRAPLLKEGSSLKTKGGAGLISTLGMRGIGKNIIPSEAGELMSDVEYGDGIQAFGMPGMSILGQLMGMNQLFGMSQGFATNRLHGMGQMPFAAPITGFTNPQADEKGEPVTYNNLCVLNFPAMRIETFEITNKVNEHAKLHFTGFIEDDGSYILTNTMVCSPIKVVYFTDKGEQVSFFAGVITNVRIYTQDGNQAIEITALSNTSTLDTMKVSGSCQNINTTYAGLMDSVAYQSGASMLYGLEEGAFADKLGTISVQYKETNWEYLKRLASHKYQGLFGDMTVEFPVFSVGALGKEYTDVELLTCEFSKDIRGYETDNVNYIQGILEEDYVVLKIETYRILKLGDSIIYENKKYYIREATYEMRNGIVVARYLLCTPNGLKQRRIKNEKLQGLSINGITMGVERDKVKIQLEIDSAYNAEYLFPYSTMSASPDGSGWYCMPQQGDLLRVYFPDEEEENCFAISSVSSYTPEEGATNDRMGDPNVRYLRTPDNKEVRLAPDGITISADDGQALIKMDNEGNIIIHGANSINMSATNDVTISATRNVSVFASDTIKLSGQSGTITMDSSGNTRLTGQYVLEN